MALYLREGGEQLEYPEKTPDNQSEYLVSRDIRDVNSPPRPGIEPPLSNIDDKFAWSERSGSI